MARIAAKRRSAAGAHTEPGPAEKTLVATVRSALVLALAVPVIVMGGWLPDVLYPYIVGKALYFRLMIELALAPWLFLIICYPAYRPLRSWLLACLTIYLLVTLLASFAGVSPTRSLWSNYERMQGWFSLAHYMLFALMLASVIRTFRHWRIVLNINLFTGLVVGLLGLYEIATGSGQRLDVTFGNPSFLASYALVNSFIAAAFLAQSLAAGSAPVNGKPVKTTTDVSQSLMRSFWVAVICLDLLMLNYSGTRGATVGLAAGIVIVLAACALCGEKRTLRMTSTCLAIGLLALLAGTLLLRNTPIVTGVAQSSPTLERFIHITSEASAVRSRISSTEVGLEAFSERPLLGWGPENYAAAYDSHVDGEAAASLFAFDQAHNRIVEEFVMAGVIGLASYAAIWLCIGWLLVGKIRHLPLDGRLFAIFVGATFAAHFVQNLFLFDTPAASVQLYLLFGFALYFARVPVSSASNEDWTQQATILSTQGVANRIESVISRSVPARIAVAAAVAAAVLGICYLMVVGPYVGSTSTYTTLSGARTGDQRFAAYRTAVSATPGLANETIRRFAEFVVEHWESLSKDERKTALELVARDVESGLEREPMEWRLHLALAELYRRASDENPDLVTLARVHTNAADMIAPGRVEVLQLKVLQHIVEGDDEAALSLIRSYFERAEPYLKRDSSVNRRLEGLRNTIEARR